jgi:hypothetical protein
MTSSDLVAALTPVLEVFTDLGVRHFVGGRRQSDHLDMAVHAAPARAPMRRPVA